MKTVKPKFPSAARRRKIIFVGVLAVAAAVWVCLPAQPFRPVEPIPAGIVDMHCHIAGIGAGGSGCFVSPRLRHNWRFKIYLHSFGVSQQGTFAVRATVWWATAFPNRSRKANMSAGPSCSRSTAWWTPREISTRTARKFMCRMSSSPTWRRGTRTCCSARR